jgi:hypothetical protein
MTSWCLALVTGMQLSFRIGIFGRFSTAAGDLCTDKQCQMAPPAPVDEVTAEAKSLWAAIAAAEEAREGAGVSIFRSPVPGSVLRARNLFRSSARFSLAEVVHK